MKKVTPETEEGDMLFARLDRAQRDQDRLQDELEWSPPPRSSRIAGPCTMERALTCII